MTEPTRDALYEETLAMLEVERTNALRVHALPSPVDDDEDWLGIAAQYAYAAECVKRVPEMEARATAYRSTLQDYDVRVGELQAEVERLRAKAAIVDAMEKRHINVRYLGADKDGELETPWRVEGVSFKGFAHGPTILAAYAAATREGTE